MKTIDLNCDVGEGMGNESRLMPFLSSCNISCGLHAGDDATIREVIDLALQHHVAIGAHPSFDDRVHFGRREMHLPAQELFLLVQGQVIDLAEKVRAEGGKMTYVKPHGALYNMAARSAEMSHAIIDAIRKVNPSLKFMGLAESEMAKASVGRIGFIAEGFADRRYSTSISLVPRDQGGLLTDFDKIEKQLTQLLTEQIIETEKGLQPLTIQSLCLHGDTPGAELMISRIRDLVISLGYEIKAA
jgi:UPF0271 protein